MPLDIMIASKKPAGPMPMPKAFGAPAAKDPSAGVQAIASGPGKDQAMGADETEGTVKPEAVCYRGPEQKCSACQYREPTGDCKILKIAVEDDASCNAFEASGGDMGGAPDDAGAGLMGEAPKGY